MEFTIRVITINLFVIILGAFMSLIYKKIVYRSQNSQGEQWPITKSDYEEDFLSKNPQLSLEKALDIRKFEINLFWRRTGYFWGITLVFLSGYFLLKTSDVNTITYSHRLLPLILTSIGIVTTMAWYLVNRGSKFWQENWERHVDMLEDSVIGPLYKTTIQRKPLDNNFLKLTTKYPFSVSSINILLSLFILLIWFFLLVYDVFSVFHYIAIHKAELIFEIPIYLLLMTTFGALSSFLVFGISGLQEAKYKFEQRKIKGNS